MTPRRCLIAAGGTGGHMFPARAAAEALIARGWQVRLVTDARGLKHTQGFPAVAIDEIHAASPSTKNPIKLAKAALELTQGFGQARSIVKGWKPDVIAGFGGYPAFPALAVAQAQGIPFAIHEQNAVLGRVNRVFAAKAGFIASGFERLDRLPGQGPQASHPDRQSAARADPEGPQGGLSRTGCGRTDQSSRSGRVARGANFVRNRTASGGKTPEIAAIPP